MTSFDNLLLKDRVNSRLAIMYLDKRLSRVKDTLWTEYEHTYDKHHPEQWLNDDSEISCKEIKL